MWPTKSDDPRINWDGERDTPVGPVRYGWVDDCNPYEAGTHFVVFQGDKCLADTYEPMGTEEMFEMWLSALREHTDGMKNADDFVPPPELDYSGAWDDQMAYLESRTVELRLTLGLKEARVLYEALMVASQQACSDDRRDEEMVLDRVIETLKPLV